MKLFVLLLYVISAASDDVWERDASSDVYIEASREGFEHVSLDCHSDTMEVTVHFDEPFEGILYTRGSYKDAAPPCYFDATGQTSASLKIPFKECHTSRRDNGTLVNTVIVQHDDWLIFPGDTAFEVACHEHEDRDVVVGASIGLADPDPAAKELPKHRKSTVWSDKGRALFTPDDVRPRRKKTKKKKKTEKEEL